jgi:hypothetical protein
MVEMGGAECSGEPEDGKPGTEGRGVREKRVRAGSVPRGWKDGVLGYWNAGMLECWSTGVLECWSAGVGCIV